MNGHAREDAIRERAYMIWETHGRVSGRELEHWLQAEREFTGAAAPRPEAQPAAAAEAPAVTKPVTKRKRAAAAPAKPRTKKES